VEKKERKGLTYENKEMIIHLIPKALFLLYIYKEKYSTKLRI
jgi:hypothetical protein